MNKLLTATILALVPFAATAGENITEGLTIKLGGDLNTQIGHIKQKKSFNHKNPTDSKSSKLNTHSIVNDTKIKIEVDGEYNTLKYGGKIKLNADTSETKSGNKQIADKTMIYVESDFGKIEAGSYGGATDNMKISAATIAKATGGIDGDGKYWINSHTASKDENGNYKEEGYEGVFLSDPYLPVGCDCAGSANKITYYTPSFNGFKVGVSYAPDSEAKGTIAKASKLTRSADKHLGYRDIYEVALQYEQKFNEFEFSGALLYQAGKARSYTYNNVQKSRKNLSAWEVGALVKYQSFSIAGSYGDWGKSGAPAEKIPGQKYGASFWNVGIAYDYQDFGASLTYFRSKRGKTAAHNHSDNDPKFIENSASRFNKVEVISLGADYKLAPGLLPYVEATHFKHNRAGAAVNNKGQVYLAGVKISF